MTFLEINGHSLHYQYLPSAGPRTFVFANSLGTDLRIWDEVATQLAPYGAILRFDKPGHGLSELPAAAPTIRGYAADVVALLDALGIGKCVFVGVSIGGMIGQRLALTHPERLERLVLSNTAPQIGTAADWDARIATVAEQGLPAITEAVLQRWFPAAFREAHPAAIAGYRAMLEGTTPAGYIGACAALRDEDLTAEVAAIQLPTLCLGGTHDLATPPALVEALAAIIPGATCHLIEGAGHVPCLQMPETVAQLILKFLAATDAAQNPPAARAGLYEAGMQTRRAVLGHAHVDRAEANKSAFDADFQRYITENAWGSIWSRPGLTLRERSMVTIALLAALGHDEELAMHLRATRNTGATPADVREVLLHTGVYAGVPITNGAMKIAKEIFGEAKT